LSDLSYDVTFTALRGEYNSQPFVFKNKMAVSQFVQVSDEEISEMKINAVPKSMQNATEYGVKLLKGKPAFCFELNYVILFILELKSFCKSTKVPH